MVFTCGKNIIVLVLISLARIILRKLENHTLPTPEGFFLSESSRVADVMLIVFVKIYLHLHF